ncbi:MAG TPA: alpha/beta family hydrolase [Anaeromyxobacteraceae bacterium]|nr:alpha/beta family hydrolase [Anaeromyxobacteraceae bacterium]
MSRPVILFAPGAGQPSTSPWMRSWARRLETLGQVFTFDYPYMLAGRRRPDRSPVLLEAHRTALSAARAGREGPVVLAGKSMGARMSCHLAAGEPAVRALVCLGYPLVGQGGEVREQVLLGLSTPVLFVQGTRDPLCPLDRLEDVRRRMTAPSDLHAVVGGNHSLLVTRGRLAAAAETQEQVNARALAAIRSFLERHLGGAGV